MYVCIYVCPSRLGMLIFSAQRVLKVSHTHAAALLSTDRRVPVLEYDGSICKMDNRPTKDDGDCM